MKEAVRRRVHGVFVVAEIWQPALDKGVQLGQGFLTVDRPREILFAGLTHRLHPGGLDFGPNRGVVMRDVPCLRRRRRALPRLPVLLVVIPFASGRGAVLVHQQTRAHAHAAIIGLHQPALGILLEMRGHSATAVKEVLGAHAGRDQSATGGKGAQILV